MAHSLSSHSTHPILTSLGFLKIATLLLHSTHPISHFPRVLKIELLHHPTSSPLLLLQPGNTPHTLHFFHYITRHPSLHLPFLQYFISSSHHFNFSIFKITRAAFSPTPTLQHFLTTSTSPSSRPPEPPSLQRQHYHTFSPLLTHSITREQHTTSTFSSPPHPTTITISPTHHHFSYNSLLLLSSPGPPSFSSLPLPISSFFSSSRHLFNHTLLHQHSSHLHTSSTLDLSLFSSPSHTTTPDFISLASLHHLCNPSTTLLHLHHLRHLTRITFSTFISSLTRTPSSP